MGKFKPLLGNTNTAPQYPGYNLERHKNKTSPSLWFFYVLPSRQYTQAPPCPPGPSTLLSPSGEASRAPCHMSKGSLQTSALLEAQLAIFGLFPMSPRLRKVPLRSKLSKLSHHELLCFSHGGSPVARRTSREDCRSLFFIPAPGEPQSPLAPRSSLPHC